MNGTVGPLEIKYVVPPFSVLDTMSQYWLKRRKRWQQFGAMSGKARAEARTFGVDLMAGELAWQEDNNRNEMPGVSIFDPVLCELMYRWFAPVGGEILDPFAGGVCRGMVAAAVGSKYTGVDLSQDTIDENRELLRAVESKCAGTAQWVQGDSNLVLAEDNDQIGKCDFVFSCPPYHDLEQYSDDPKDLSNMTWADFGTFYTAAIKRACSRLRPNRFAAFVIGEIREKGAGYYKNFMGLTIEAFEAAGCRYYNEIILLNSIGSLPLRCARTWEPGRKVGRRHQTVLVFCKGDPKQAATAAGEMGECPVDLPSMGDGNQPSLFGL